MEPYFKESMIVENKSLDNQFEAEKVEFKFKPRKRKGDDDSEPEDLEVSADQTDKKGLVDIERPMVWCSNLERFMGYLMSERGYNANELDVKIGIDFGQESLKVQISEPKIQIQQVLLKVVMSLQQLREIVETEKKRSRYFDVRLVQIISFVYKMF